jgi:hypothetical protein
MDTGLFNVVGDFCRTELYAARFFGQEREKAR